jgi:hypothetical protein
VEALLAETRDLPVGVLGQDEPPATWAVVTTAGFEFVRPSASDLDRRPIFQANSILV